MFRLELLQGQGADERRYLPSHELLIPLQCLWRLIERTAEPRRQILTNGLPCRIWQRAGVRGAEESRQFLLGVFVASAHCDRALLALAVSRHVEDQAPTVSAAFRPIIFIAASNACLSFLVIGMHPH